MWSSLKKRCSESGKALLAKSLPVDVVVSVIVATFDRPDDLRNCLRCLVAQETARQVEIIVVDNNPASGFTPPVVAEFSSVILINETRKGLSYARNSGFTAGSGSICIATDDDVTMPVDWLEKLIAPFVRADIMVVTGNVLPAELKNDAQILFENYGGLGKGFTNREVNGAWFDSSHSAVATWHLGATANAAFRSNIFSHPQIGLLNEALGAGTPTGCSEDTYLFYKVLKAGYTVHYEADAYVWHRHRHSIEALRKQLYNYSKGHVAYNLMTWLTDGDWRGLRRVVFEVPFMFLRRTKARIRGRSNYPLKLLWVEVKGHLSGAWALWRAHQRVKRLGRSTPYLQRSTEKEVNV
jgi:glycosyltransferase involved in cell wall biosynthesis